MSNQEMPQIPEMGKNLLGTARDVLILALKKGEIVAGQEAAEKRISICSECEHLTPEFRCCKCGCYMKLKWNLQGAFCPIQKW